MEYAWVPAFAQAVTVALAAWGLTRVRALDRLLPDARLERLAWFFGLIAAATALQLLAGMHPWVEAAPWRPVRDQPTRVLMTLHHALLAAAMAVAVRAYGSPSSPNGPRPPVAAALAWPPIAWIALQAGRRPPPGWRPPRPEPGFWSGPFGLLRGIEAALALYIAARALLNAIRRRSRRSLIVAGGFLSLFVAHAGFWLLAIDGAPRHLLGEAAMALGVTLLVAALPRPPRGL